MVFNIGEWPSDVDDGELSPFSMMMLAENTGIENLITRVRQGQIDLSDLSNESLQDLALVGELAWELKNWLYQLQTKGHSQLSGVIEKTLGANTKAERHADMIAGLPQIITDSVQRQWFAGLDSELTQYQQGFTTETNTSSSRAIIPKVNNMSGGGWYVDGYAIRYRPSGHNDAFMRQWIESTSVAAKNSSTAETVRAAFVDDDAPGQCVKCHAVGSSVGEMPQWTSEQSIQIKSFTRFDHQAHLILTQEEGCVACHQTAAETDFQAIKKQQCIGCHTEPLAGNDCLTCHNYHIDNLSSLTSSSSLSGF